MTSFAFVIALALITTGAALIFLPAGFIVAGSLLAWVSLRLDPGVSA